jgi:hypothetical protein
MSTTGTKKSQEPEDNDLDYKQEKRREDIEAHESAEQADLNQGMQTGTHDTARHGVNWGSSYETPQNLEPLEIKDDANARAKKKKDENPDGPAGDI